MRLGKFLFFLLLLVTAARPAHSQNPQNIVEGFTPPSITPGAPAGSFLLSGFESVHPYSGKLNFALPLLQIGGRGEAGYTVTLPINQTWIVDTIQFTCSGGGSSICFRDLPQHNWWTTRQPGYSPGTMFGRTASDEPLCEINHMTEQLTRTLLTRLTFTMPDGSEIELRDEATHGAPKTFTQAISCDSNMSAPSGQGRGKIFKSTDGSAVTFYSDSEIFDSYNPNTFNIIQTLSGQLHFPDGVTYRIDQSKVTSIRDRNGNFVSLTYDGTNRVTSARDPLHRLVTFTYGTGSDTIEYAGYGDDDRTITVSHAALAAAAADFTPPNLPVQCTPTQSPCTTAQVLFPEASHAIAITSAFNPSVVSGVTLPNGKTYTFKYNRYAELAYAQLPTGGRFEYTWGPLVSGTSGYYADGNKMILRRVTERRAYGDAGALITKEVFASTTSGTGVGQTQASIEHRDTANTLLAKERRTYYGKVTNAADVGNAPTSYSAWEEGLEFKTERFASDGSSILRTVDQTWALRPLLTGEPNPWPGGKRDPRMTLWQETYNGANLYRKKEYGYDRYNNRTSEKEYSFGSFSPAAGSTLVRETITAFVTTHQSRVYDTNLDVHLRRLPESIQIKNGSSQVVSQIQFSYDDASPDAASGIVRHCSSSGITCLSNTGSILSFDNSYAPRGNVSSITRGTGADATTVTQTFDIAGNVKTYKDGLSRIWNLTYSPTTHAFLTQIQDPAPFSGFSRSASYDPSTGAITTFTDRNGVNTSFAYSDQLDRLTHVTEAANKPEATTTTAFKYDDTALTVETHSTKRSDETATSGAPCSNCKLRSKVFFDNLGRQKEYRTYTKISDSTTHVATCTQYDGLNRVWRTSNPGDNACTSEWTQTTYDSLGRVTQILHPDNSAINTSYSAAGSLFSDSATTTDEASVVHINHMDALDRLVRVRENGISSETCYTYDPLDNLTSVRQNATITEGVCSNGLTRTFTYDTLSRLKTALNPESGTTSYTYDNNSNLKTRSDPRPVTATHLYDELNRITGTTYSGSSQPTPAVTYVYDDVLVAHSKGRLTRTSNSNSTTNITAYDPLGRITAGNQVAVGQTYLFSYTYDVDGTLKTQSYPSGVVVAYQYDSAGRPLTAGRNTPGQTHFAHTAQYAAHGAPTSLTLGNGFIEKALYNERLQPTYLWLECGSLSGCSADPWKIELSYNHGTNNGNIAYQTLYAVPLGSDGSAVVNWRQEFTYDLANRLQVAKEFHINPTSPTIWQRNYAYDKYGNRAATGSDVGVPTPTRTTDFNTSNRITTTFGATYDPGGNMTEFDRPGDAYDWTAAYDANNKQTLYCDKTTSACTVTNYTVRYYYDGDGNRVGRESCETSGCATTVYVYNAFGKLSAEYGVSGAGANDGLTFRTTDHLGTTRIVTNTSGKIVMRQDLFPFGETIPANASYGGRHLILDGLSGTTYNQPVAFDQKFTAKERDAKSGLDYFGARYFSASLGRFTGPDKPFVDQFVVDPQSWNLYAYTRNNPLKYVDKNGDYIETAWDVANVGLGVASFIDNVSQGNYGSAALDAVGVVLDSAAVVAPLVPAGAESSSRGSGANRLDNALDAGKTVERVDGATDAGKAAGRTTDASGANGPFETSPENLERMSQGKAPRDPDGKPVELHHQNQNPQGPLQEMTQQDHRGKGNYKRNHPQGNQQPSRIDRNEAARQRREYWKRRAEDLQREPE